jgi:flagellar hook-associated protein 2
MATPITFSGFNQIDFNVILNAVMEQESRPLQALQAQQKALQATDSSYGQLASKLDALRTATTALSRSSSLVTYAATSSDTTAVTVSATRSASAGTYDIVVNELASAQVTVSQTWSPDTNTTAVATGGTLTVGSATITLTGSVTLSELKDAINANSTSPASASIIQTAPGQYRLLLTAKEAGQSNGFTIQNGLTASTITFTDTDNDNISGDSAADNSVQALDADVLVNNVQVTSDTNTLDSVIPGVTLTLLKKNTTAVVNVTRDDDDLANRVEAFATAYNDLVKFADEQALAGKNGKSGNLASDSVLKGVRRELRTALLGAHGSGTFTRLSEVGLEFTKTGQLTLDRAALTEAIGSDPTAVSDLFANSSSGAFVGIDTLLKEYTNAGGFVPDARARLTDELQRLGRRMDDVQARLAVRRAALQKEFIAADLAMSRLNAQRSAIASFGANLSSF